MTPEKVSLSSFYFLFFILLGHESVALAVKEVGKALVMDTMAKEEKILRENLIRVKYIKIIGQSRNQFFLCFFIKKKIEFI